MTTEGFGRMEVEVKQFYDWLSQRVHRQSHKRTDPWLSTSLEPISALIFQ